jgi:hypothetical protein
MARAEAAVVLPTTPPAGTACPGGAGPLWPRQQRVDGSRTKLAWPGDHTNAASAMAITDEGTVGQVCADLSRIDHELLSAGSLRDGTIVSNKGSWTLVVTRVHYRGSKAWSRCSHSTRAYRKSQGAPMRSRRPTISSTSPSDRLNHTMRSHIGAVTTIATP